MGTEKTIEIRSRINVRAVTANLKLYYQARSLWLYYAAVIPFFFIWLIFSGGPERFNLSIGYLAFCLFLGIVTGDLQRTVLTRPFSYLLPNHRKVPAAMLILAACGIFVLGLLCYARVLGFGGPPEPVLAAIFLGILLFFIAAGLAIELGAFIILAAFFFPLVLSSGTLRALENILLTFPLFSIVLSLLICTVFLKLLNIESLARRLSGKSTPALSEGFNYQKTQKYWQTRSAERAAKRGAAGSDALASLFLRFSKRFSEARGKYLLGNLYLVFGFYLSQSMWWTLIFFIPLAVLFFGYFAGGRLRNFIFLLPILFLIGVNLMPHQAVLLARGRRERLFAATTSGLILTVFVSLMMLLLALLSNMIAPMLPEIQAKGEILTYHPMEIQYFVVCLLFVPLSLLLVALFPKQRIFLVAIAYGGGTLFTADYHPSLFSMMGFPATVGLVAAVWLVFILIISYHCRKGDLVGQGG